MSALRVGLAHALLAVALCWDALLLGRVPYLRDVPVLYASDFAFLAQCLDAGLWPLWHPLIDGGRPFLFGYPPDVVLVGLFGWQGALRAEGPVHLWIAASGASFLAVGLGHRLPTAWAAGAFFACSGYVLALGSLFPLLQAAAWAPWVVGTALRVMDRAEGRCVAALALVAALQVSSLSAELVIQTWIVIVVLGGRWGEPRRWRAVAWGVLLAAALSAPVVAGTAAMAADSARAATFGPGVTLGWSMHPLALPGLVVPRYFGDMHTFSDAGYWGQPLFEDGYPYLLSTYLGAVVVLLAAMGATRRLALMALAGLLVASGAHGPLAPVLLVLLRAAHVRGPSKFLFLTTFAVVLMAARGLTRARTMTIGLAALGPGVVLTSVAAALFAVPQGTVAALGSLVPALQDPRAVFVMRHSWPADLLQAGLLALLSGVLLWRRRLLPLVGVLAVVDLVAAGADLNLHAPPAFYQVREPLRSLVERTRDDGRFRWFSYDPGAQLTFAPALVRANRDLPLYALEVQSLLPRTHVLLGLEGAFDEDRTGFAPRGSTLHPDERRPSRFREIHAFLRLGNVRYVVGFDPLPEDLVQLRGLAPQPEVAEPLRVHELRDPLPRAFWVPRFEVAADPATYRRRSMVVDFDPRQTVLLPAPPPALDGAESAPGEPKVIYERPDPHTVRLHVSTPPGFVVVLDGHDPGWRLRDDRGEVPLLRANGRYWAFPTRGGVRTLEAQFAPAWRRPAYTIAVLGFLATAMLAMRRPRSAAPTASGSPGTP